MNTILLPLLQEIGLNKSEANVYLTLLDLGPSTTGPIMSKAKISSSKIYGIVERLIEKGLVSFILQGKTRYYQASSPDALLEYFHEREKQMSEQKIKLDHAIHLLKARQTRTKERQEARIFLGWKGIQAAYNHVLDVLPAGSDFIGFVQPTDEEERKEVKLFYLQYHKKRVENQYHTKLISNHALRRVFEHEPYHSFTRFEVRYVDHCPSGLVIFADNILLIAFEKNPVAVLVTSREIAASYRTLFYAIWKEARR